MVRPLRETVRWFLKKLKRPERRVSKKTLHAIFIAVLLTIVKIINGWMDKYNEVYTYNGI